MGEQRVRPVVTSRIAALVQERSLQRGSTTPTSPRSAWPAQRSPDTPLSISSLNLATHKTPAIRDWLTRHPRFHLHFTPTGSSWINQVERWFGSTASDNDDWRVGRAVLLGD